MADTLVTKTKRRISAVNDDFFHVDMIVDALNKAQRKVISYAVQKERESPTRSLRALDLVRRRSLVAIEEFAQQHRYYTATIGFPSIDMSQFLYLQLVVADSSFQTPLREIVSSRLHLIEAGNMTPSRYEGYYHVGRQYTNGVKAVERIQLATGPSDGQWVDSTLTITGIKSKVEIECKANVFNTNPDTFQFSIESSFAENDTVTVVINGSPNVVTGVNGAPGAAGEFDATSSTDTSVLAANIAAAFGTLNGGTGITGITATSSGNVITLTRANGSYVFTTVTSTATIELQGTPQSAAYLIIGGVGYSFMEPTGTAAEVATSLGATLTSQLPAGFTVAVSGTLVTIYKNAGGAFSITGDYGYTRFVATLTSPSFVPDLTVTVLEVDYTVPILATDLIVDVYDKLIAAITTPNVTKEVVGPSLVITPTTQQINVGDALVFTANDCIVATSSTQSPIFQTITLRAMIDSIPRLVTYTNNESIDDFVLNLIAAVNADGMFYFSAALDPEDGTNKTILFTAKGEGSKFNNSLVVKDSSSLTVTKTNVTPGADPSAQPVFDLFLHTNDTENAVRVHYVDNPKPVTAYDEKFADLPEQLENAAIYAACTMLLMSEKPSEESKNVTNFSQLYQEEIQASLY